MPRTAQPRWNRILSRWYANIGPRDASGRATEVFAPPEIGKGDGKKAWEWFEARKKAIEPVRVDHWTVEAVAEHYLAHLEGERDNGRCDPVHYENRRLHLLHLADRFGPRAASSLSPDEVTAWLQALSYSPHYRANIAAGVSAAFRWASRKGFLPRNPIEGFRAPTIPRARARFAERSEIAAVLGWAWRHPGRDAYAREAVLLVRCLAATGARPGEMCGLRWSDIDWAAGKTPEGHVYARATIPPDRWKAGGKTGRDRVIYFTPGLTRSLWRLQARTLGRAHVFAHGSGRGGAGDGDPWRDGSTLSKRIKAMRLAALEARSRLAARVGPPRALERLILSVELAADGPDRWTAYRLRHTAASALLMHGHDLYTVAELLGTSAEVIQSTYGHLLDGHLARAAQAIRRAHREAGRS